MLRVTDIAEGGTTPSPTLTLPFVLRRKSRQRTRLDDGTEVGIALARGTVLRSGDRLRAADGLVIGESVSTARSEDGIAFARACYHLGNRHLPLQIRAGWLRYLHDHVLDDMGRGLGLEVVHEHAPFEPEGGACGGHGTAGTLTTITATPIAPMRDAALAMASVWHETQYTGLFRS